MPDQITPATLPESKTDKPSSHADSTSPIKPSFVFICKHNTSLRGKFKDWEMTPYKVEKNGRVIEEGFSCPKCYKVQVTYKKT